MSHGPPDILAHRVGDSVAVAVRPLRPGLVEGGHLHASGALQVTVSSDVPLGHKIALVNLKKGEPVIEYGVQIGLASAPILAGDYVHVHNLRSARWQSSVA